MLDERPTAAELIAAVADFLERKAIPELQGHTGFHARVAVNALRIVERELRDGEGFVAAERAGLLALLGDADPAADLNALNRALCERIADGRLAGDDPALRAHLWRSVRARMAIDSPKYPSLQAAPS